MEIHMNIWKNAPTQRLFWRRRLPPFPLFSQWNLPWAKCQTALVSKSFFKYSCVFTIETPRDRFEKIEKIERIEKKKSQKQGQEDQVEVKELGGALPRALRVHWSSWPSFWLFPGLPGSLASLELHQTSLRKALFEGIIGIMFVQQRLTR